MTSPKTRRRRSAPGFTAAKNILLAVAFVLVILVIGIGILSFTDIAGDMVLGIATETVREQTGLTLSVERVKGNPIVGYTLVGISLDREGEPKQNVFAADTLNLTLNFRSLLSGSPRLSLLSVGGVNMNVDRLIEEIAALDIPEGSGEGGGEVPIDRITVVDSRFDSMWGTIEVRSVGANISGTSMAVDLAAAINGVPVSGNLDANIQGQRTDIRRLELQLGAGRLSASGNVQERTIGHHYDDDTAINFQGTLRAINISDIVAMVPADMLPDLSPADFAGNADLDFTVGGTISDPTMTGRLNFSGSRIGGFPLESIASDLEFINPRFAAQNVRATTMGIPVEGEFAIALRDEGVTMMLKLDGSGASLAEIARLNPDIGEIGGTIDRFSVDVHGLVTALSGLIEFSAPNITFSGMQIRNASAQVRLARGDTAALNGEFLFEGAQANVQGSVTILGAGLDLTARLSSLDIRNVKGLIPDAEDLALSGLVNADVTIRGTAAAPVVSGTVSSPRFSAMGNALENPSVSFTYANDTFTLRESSGSWNGLPIRASGTVSPVTSPTPNVDMTAQLSLNTETLRLFVPDVEQYNLRGTINAGVKITGRLPHPNIELLASSESLSAMGMVSARNIEVTTAMTGDLTAMDRIDLTLRAASAAAGGVGLQNISATVRKDGQQIRLENASAASGGGSITGGGSINLGATAGAPAQLNLSFDMNRLDLAPLAQTGGLGMALSGLLSGRVAVTGSSANPNISFEGQAPSVAVEGMTLTNLTANVSGDASALRINNFRGNVGEAPLSATGTIALTEPFRADIDISGSGLSLASFIEGMPDLRGQIHGNADLQFSLRATAAGNSGSGSIRSAAITAFGLRTTDIVAPLALTGNTLNSQGATLNLYGGSATNNFALNMDNMTFTNEVNVGNVDVNALLQDATGGLGGRITGRGNLSFQVNGSIGDTPDFSGSGLFTMGEGSVTGFPGLGLLSTLYGVDGIRYTQVNAPLRLTNDRLIIARGTTVTPPANDPIYRGARLTEDGAVTFDNRISFVVEADVNFQLVNALAGGVVGGVEALLGGGSVQNILSSGNLESALRGVISGGREQGRGADFRDVTARVSGTVEHPSVSLVRVGQGHGEANQEAPAIQTPAVPQLPAMPPQETIQEAIRDRVIDAIIPTRPERPQQEAQEAPPVQESVQQEQPAPPPPVEQQIEQRIEEEVRRGIDNLLRRRR